MFSFFRRLVIGPRANAQSEHLKFVLSNLEMALAGWFEKIIIDEISTSVEARISFVRISFGLFVSRPCEDILCKHLVRSVWH